MTTLDSRPMPVTGLPAGPFRTTPNLITLARTVAALAIGTVAIVRADPGWLVAAYGVYWLGDILDGWSARRLDQETRAGAVLDVICDRACTAVLCACLLGMAPQAAPAVVVFLVSFLVVDTMLSLAFLAWPITSPNYFDRVDRTIWRLNWSPAAKACNTALVIGALALGRYDVALVAALVVLGVKVWSVAAVARILR